MLACYHFLINLIGKVQLKDIHSYLCWWTISVQTNLFGRINIRVLHHYKLLNYLNNYMLWTIYLVALESHDWYHCHDCVAVICLVERLKQREICLIMFEEVYASHRQNKKNLLLSLLKNRLFSKEGQCGDFDGRKIKTRVTRVTQHRTCTSWLGGQWSLRTCLMPSRNLYWGTQVGIQWNHSVSHV